MAYFRNVWLRVSPCLVGSSILVSLPSSSLTMAQFDVSAADERWLKDEIGAIVTAEEEATFRRVRPEDRELFKEVFWIRRDPDLSTPENEFRLQFDRRRSRADEMYRSAGREGSATEIGRIYLLMGDPDRTGQDAAQSAAIGSGARPGRASSPQGDNPVTRSGLGGQMAGSDRAQERPGRAQDMTWVYDANTDLRLVEELTLDFRIRPPLGWVLATSGAEEIFESVREARIGNPSIRYLLGDDGVLDRPAELDAFELSPAKAILRDLRQSLTIESDFSFKPSVSFFFAADGTVYSPLLLDIDPAGWDWQEDRADAVVFGLLETNDGSVVFDFEEPVSLSRDRLQLSIPLQATPGVYRLLIGLHDPSAESVTTKIISLPIPGIASDVLSTSTVLLLSGVERREGEPSVGNAYQFADLRLEPNPTGRYETDDELSAFYYVYGFESDESGEGRLTAQYRFYLEGEPYKQYRAKTLPAQGYQSGDLIQIPLADFERGGYQLEIIIRDELAGTSMTKVIAFRIGT